MEGGSERERERERVSDSIYIYTSPASEGGREDGETELASLTHFRCTYFLSFIRLIGYFHVRKIVPHFSHKFAGCETNSLYIVRPVKDKTQIKQQLSYAGDH